MKVRQTVLSRVVRQVAVAGTGAPRIDVVRKIKDRYDFQKWPEKFEETFPELIAGPLAAGITFLEGKFKIDDKVIGINVFQLKPGVIFADTRSSTDHSEAFLEDYISRANAETPDCITSTGPTYYVSQIEFTMERVPDIIAPMEQTGKTIDRLLDDYGLKVPKYGFWGTTINTDPHQLGILPPAFFALERRVGFPFSSKVFFSQAPLRTKDHIALLEQLDSPIQ
jgi:hypothetical protein